MPKSAVFQYNLETFDKQIRTTSMIIRRMLLVSNKFDKFYRPNSNIISYMNHVSSLFELLNLIPLSHSIEFIYSFDSLHIS